MIDDWFTLSICCFWLVCFVVLDAFHPREFLYFLCAVMRTATILFQIFDCIMNFFGSRRATTSFWLRNENGFSHHIQKKIVEWFFHILDCDVAVESDCCDLLVLCTRTGWAHLSIYISSTVLAMVTNPTICCLPFLYYISIRLQYFILLFLFRHISFNECLFIFFFVEIKSSTIKWLYEYHEYE